MNLPGIRVVEHPLAIDVVHRVSVVRWPVKKRRRGWRVLKERIEKPACWKMADGTLYMHPTLYAQLKNHDSTR